MDWVWLVGLPRILLAVDIGRSLGSLGFPPSGSFTQHSLNFAGYWHWREYVDILWCLEMQSFPCVVCRLEMFSLSFQVGCSVRRRKYWPALMVSKSFGLWATIRWTKALLPTPGGPTSTCKSPNVTFFDSLKAFWEKPALTFLRKIKTIRKYNILNIFMLWPGFCGRKGAPSLQARTAASRQRPPPRSSWRCNRTSSSPSSATKTLTIKAI